jgi:hypothetical protein
MAPKINAYRFGEMVVDGISYRQDIIIFPDYVRDSWWRKKGHEIHSEDLTEVLSRADIDVLIIGKGDPGLVEIMSEAIKAVESKGWALIVEPTTEAWETYNTIRSSQKVVGAFHLTC